MQQINHRLFVIHLEQTRNDRIVTKDYVLQVLDGVLVLTGVEVTEQVGKGPAGVRVKVQHPHVVDVAVLHEVVKARVC